MGFSAVDNGIIRDQHDAKIVFFDVETTVPFRRGQKHELLEFAAVVLDARGLSEVHSYTTLIRPKGLDNINHRSIECNGITKESVANAPTFAQVADEIHRLLDGRIWAGHNIEKFDILRVNEAFSEIARPAPKPAGIVDTYPLLRNTFGRRAGNLKLATLASYCGYGKQEHRSLADVRMNLDVLKSCATILFLESNYPDIFTAAWEIRTSASTVKQSATLSILGEQIRKSREDRLPNEGEPSAKSSGSITMLSHEHTRDQHAFFTEGGKACSPLLETKTDASELAKLGARLCLSETMIDCTSACIVDHTSIASSVCAEKAENNGHSNPEQVPEILEDSVCQEGILESHRYSRKSTAKARINMKAGSGVSNRSSLGTPNSGMCGNGHLSTRTEGGFNRPLEDDSLICVSETAMLEGKIELGETGIEEGYDVSEALFSMSLSELEDVQAAEASDICNTRADNVFSMVHTSEPALTSTDVERGCFLLASCVSLGSIEVQNKDSNFGCKKTLFFKGSPLQIFECNTKIRFTVNPRYAFTDSGRPQFSIWIEPSQSACEVIARCDELVKSNMAEQCTEATWLPLMKQERGIWGARMSIGTKGFRYFATYTTKFYRATENGIQEIALGHVDAVAFRNLLPHGSLVDIGFDFDVFNINNRAGIRLVAKHITLT